ncbi:MAG TPA: hypothetical protein VFH88_07965 [Candidatus Krumholzibacteria bacterium]|nr:hypothetical protein [Candidatus Krumholzibacteria bacterium]
MKLIASLLLAALVGASPLEPAWVTDFRYCDLVVKGQVTDVTVEVKPRRQAMPMVPGGNDDSGVDVATTTLAVDEVMRGNTQQDSIRFVSFVGASLFKKNYSVGQELIVGLNWGKDVLGGSYWLFSEHGRFIHEENGWVNQGDGRVLTDLTELQKRLSDVSPESVLNQCELAVVGAVDSMKAKTIYGPDKSDAVQWSIFLRDSRSIRGATVPSEIAIRQITSGNYWPDWRDPAPLRSMIEPGTRYCFFLKKIEDGYAPVRGINGMFEVRDDSLYFAGRTPIDITIDDIKRASK